VRDEASYARKEGKLVPVRLGEAEPPMGFRQIQALDFRDWRGDALSPEFVALRSAIAELLAGHSGATTTVAAKVCSHYFRRRPAMLAVAALLAGVAATIGYLNSPLASGAGDIALGKVEVQPFLARPDDVERNALAASYADAFRQRFTELGIPNEPASEGKRGATELIFAGELTQEGEKEILTARLQDRMSGATLWSIRRPPTEGAAWEANLASFAVKCALKRRNPKGATEVFSRYLYGCGSLGTRAAELVASREGLSAAARIYDLVRPFDPARIASHEMMTQVFYGDVEKAAKSLAERPDVGKAHCPTEVLAVRRKEKLDGVRFAEACGGGYDFSARCFAIAGDLDTAFREIEVVLDSGGRITAPHLFWPEMRHFLRDPRFWPLAVRLGLVDYWLDTGQWPDFCREADLPFDCKEKAQTARDAARRAG